MAEPLPESASTGDLAGLLGVTARQVRNLLDTAEVQAVARGQWPLGPAVRAVLAHARRNREGDELAKARARQLNAPAKHEEIVTATAERGLIPMTEAETVVAELMAVVVAELDGLPARITRDRDLRRTVEVEVTGARARMAAATRQAAGKLKNGDEDDDTEDGF